MEATLPELARAQEHCLNKPAPLNKHPFNPMGARFWISGSLLYQRSEQRGLSLHAFPGLGQDLVPFRFPALSLSLSLSHTHTHTHDLVAEAQRISRVLSPNPMLHNLTFPAPISAHSAAPNGTNLSALGGR